MWVLASLLVIGIGIYYKAWWILLAGLAMLGLSMAKPKSEVTRDKAEYKHRLVQAPIDAWDTGDEDMLTFLAAEHGMPTHLGVDILGPISEKLGGNLKPLEAGLLRQMLPFKSYGESSALQRLLEGMVLPIDNWIYPKTFEAKFKGKLGGSEKKTYVLGDEKEAEKALKEDEKDKKK